jgi:hypothetical protein
VEEREAPPIAECREESSTSEGSNSFDQLGMIDDDRMIVGLGTVLDDIAGHLGGFWTVREVADVGA